MSLSSLARTIAKDAIKNIGRENIPKSSVKAARYDVQKFVCREHDARNLRYQQKQKGENSHLTVRKRASVFNIVIKRFAGKVYYRFIFVYGFKVPFHLFFLYGNIIYVLRRISQVISVKWLHCERRISGQE